MCFLSFSILNGGEWMKKIDKTVADAYFRERTRNIVIYLIIWFIVSFGIVLFAESLSNFQFIGFPFHYYMGAQGAVVVFIILLFVNAKQSDKIDEKYGIDESQNEHFSSGKALDH
jgi:putative solute:sodium symporter small subunit